jgi:NhaP-type Na+/H+ or K+/H+ antiporter
VNGNSETLIVIIGTCLVFWGIFGGRIERFNVSGPMAFVIVGIAVNNGPWALTHVAIHSSSAREVAEFTLALVLFSDASRLSARTLKSDAGLSLRLLGIGLPLTLVVATLVAALIIPGVSWWIAALVAAIVAPTDAALGASIMTDQRVPSIVRRLLNIESGLNDGIVTPFVNMFLAGALSAENVLRHGTEAALREVSVGIGIGIGVGGIGAILLVVARRHSWNSSGLEPIAGLGIALVSYTASLQAGGNGFIAAFVAGITFGTIVREAPEQVVRLTSEAGEVMSLAVWFTFGAVMLVPGFREATWRDIVFAVLALTAARMIPVALSLVGAHFDRSTVAFIGWFGPRGLASIVFALLAVDQLSSSDGSRVLSAATVTIALSVVAHGVAAGPLTNRYQRRLATLEATSRENVSVDPGPRRRAHRVTSADAHHH